MKRRILVSSTPDQGGKDLFFHRTALETLEQSVEEGTRVEYEIGSGAKGPQAKAVRTLTE